MKKISKFIAITIVFAFVTLSSSAGPLTFLFPMLNCCEAHCPHGDCHINGGAGSCTCNCDPLGNPNCRGTKKDGSIGDNNICINSTQYGNLQGILSVYQNFNSQEGAAAAAIVQSMIDLFNSNNYSLIDNSDGGDVQTYESLLTQIEALQFSQSEWLSINQFLNSCSSGDPCGGN